MSQSIDPTCRIGNAPRATHVLRFAGQGARKQEIVAFGSLRSEPVRLNLGRGRALEGHTATTSLGAGYEVLAFGPFRFDPLRHVLREGDKPIRLRSRALGILLALVERAGETVSMNELHARVWRNSVVVGGALRVHMAALRKILGDGKSGIRYVENVSGRGYRFVAPVTRLHEMPEPACFAMPAVATEVTICGAAGALAYRANNLPTPLTRMLGRSQARSMLAARVPQQRFVTVTGPGGIGKTTLAVSVAETLAPSYPHGVCLVDLALLTEPRGIAGALAYALGLVASAPDPLSDILTFLQDKSLLLLLDNCEHLIETAASLVEKVLRHAPGVHILATSRERLRAEGESVHRLAPLAMPQRESVRNCAEALAFPALQLFVERAGEASDTFNLNEAEVPLIAEICRRLDGNPLAIELAAGHVDLLGVAGVATRLDRGLHLFVRGRRTAVPRHQTLRATFEWSYELLSTSEQIILRRLAVFVGSFDLRSVSALAADDTVNAARVFEGLINLVAKSLIVAEVTAEKVLYRLLDTTRSHALEKLCDSGELTKIQRRAREM